MDGARSEQWRAVADRPGWGEQGSVWNRARALPSLSAAAGPSSRRAPAPDWGGRGWTVGSPRGRPAAARVRRSREGTRLHRDLRPVNNLFLFSDKKLKKIHLVGLNIPFRGCLAGAGGYTAVFWLSNLLLLRLLQLRGVSAAGIHEGSARDPPGSRGGGAEARVTLIAPTTYCSKLGMRLCFLPRVKVMQ